MCTYITNLISSLPISYSSVYFHTIFRVLFRILSFWGGGRFMWCSWRLTLIKELLNPLLYIERDKSMKHSEYVQEDHLIVMDITMCD